MNSVAAAEQAGEVARVLQSTDLLAKIQRHEAVVSEVQTMRIHLAAIAILVSFGLPRVGGQSTTQPSNEIDFAKTVASAWWNWDDSLSRIPGSIQLKNSSEYDVSVLFKHDKSELTFAILSRGKQIYSWLGTERTVLCIVKDRLYYVDFEPGGGGHVVIAIDLATAKEKWRSELVGINVPSPHSASVLLLNLSADMHVLRVYGQESGDRYYEIKSSDTGETLGHKLFDANDDAPPKR